MPDILRAIRYEPNTIDPENKNTSHGLIIDLVGRNKAVLEVGNSTGYLSKIFRENGNRVTGIDIDREAGSIAQQYCETMVFGDIEIIDLDAYLKDSYFDVIVFGDVLEHLKSPEQILIKVKKYLKSDGYLVVSLPNGCHGDIILNLLFGDFRYTPMGLHDVTHLRFFGWKNILDMFNDHGYMVINVNKVRVPVGNTELKVDKDKVPDDLFNFIKSIPDSDVYQYVFTAIPGDIKNNTGNEQTPIIQLAPIFNSAIEGTLEKRVELLKEEILKVSAENQELLRDIERLDDQNSTLKRELSDMRQSSIWRLVMAYHNGFVERFLPHDTRRRKAYDRILISARKLVNGGLGGLSKKYSHHKKNKAMIAAKPKFPRIVENSVPPYKRIRQIKNYPLISIIIVTYNSERFIGNAIDSIIGQNYPPASTEIIVVDNNSRDKTAVTVNEYMEKYNDKIKIKLVETNKNNGFGKGVNIGVLNASPNADYVLLFNPDCKLYKDTLTELISAASATISDGYRLWECRQMPYEHPKHYSPVTLETSWSSGACCLIHKDAFENVGGFDENIFLYMEDVDLSWRLRMNGYKLMYLPFARVQHDTYSEANVVKSAQYYNSVLYQFYLRYKYGNREDIKWYYKEYFRLLNNVPNKLPYERSKLIEQFVKHSLLIPKALAFRIKNRKALKSFKPWFMDYDFEFRREGAFVKSDIDMEDPSLLPKVSIIVRTIGRKGFLREALTSIRNQTYGNIETIVVEDGPATVKEMLDQEFSRMDIKYFALGENHGRCRAGNFGLNKCTGEYLRFLDDDDLLYPTSIETAVCFMLKDDGEHRLMYDLSFEVPTEIISEDPFKYREFDYRLTYDQNFDRNILSIHNYMPIQNVLFDRELYELYGGFDESLDALEDWDLWIRYSQHTDFFKIPKITSLYRVPAVENDIEKRQVKLDKYYKIVKEKYNLPIGQLE
ncbi:hypothetical protein MCP_0244 [Methanocella paludicola SANAE]|uniref:Glycosyltransferase 2-like domain-containing protein n=1 Tax=Methanocella paludicola (strain DSM 17711 / JCM 13418 / NBRC 101707 / SANAE) TaxID=304371 RepID=D1YV44_METPS|nr:glycosyltransferase [Methanocella paludicola]BAI60316.1 hypothetical protein MCP_0244 [Methanocella paludicola SANAE]